MRRLAERQHCTDPNPRTASPGQERLEAKKDSKNWRRILVVWISFEVGVGVAFNVFSHEADLSPILWRVGEPP